MAAHIRCCYVKLLGAVLLACYCAPSVGKALGCCFGSRADQRGSSHVPVSVWTQRA